MNTTVPYKHMKAYLAKRAARIVEPASEGAAWTQA
jgi:hypothetical protein